MADRGNPSRVKIEVVEIQGAGECSYGHRVGDSFVVEANESVPGLCGWAFNSIMPFLTVLRFGGELPWEEDKDTALVCCPDPANPVVFRLTRLSG